MDPTNIKELLNSILVEVLKYRYWIVAIFVVVSSVVLGASVFVPKSYKSSVVLYADQTNIIGDLLAGSAQITKIDRTREIRNVIYTNRMLTSVAVRAGLENPEDAVGSLRRSINVRSRGDYVDIEFSSSSQDQAFTVISTITDLFIKETARKKREESEGAFEFIDAQVNTYKAQLEEAEQRLKEFSSLNIDVSEGSVSNRVSSLKRDIQLIELELQDSNARLASFERQLASESRVLNVEVARTNSFQEQQLEDYERQLSSLRLTYLDSHPDIVILLSQMDALKEQISNDASLSQRNVEQVENPAYTSLKDAVNQEAANQNAKSQRLGNLKALLDLELENAEIAADKQATYSELTRDYAVTKGVYDDMLQRREKARLSMTLDVQGQGVSYKIHEPPLYPVKSEGLQVVHYAIAGPVIAAGLPMALILALIVLEPKVRSTSYMEQNLPPQIELITHVPVYDNVISEYASRRSIILLGGLIVGYLLLYALATIALDSTSFNLANFL